MSTELKKRLSQLPGAKTEKKTQHMTIAGLGEVVEELKKITMAQQTSQAAITKSIDTLSKVVLNAQDKGIALPAVQEAVTALQKAMQQKASAPHDYVITFDRDKNLLMKSGVRLEAVPKRLN